VLVRQDIPLADQIVQVGHVCQNAGARWGIPATRPLHLVVLAVRDEMALEKARYKLGQARIELLPFWECDSAVAGGPPMGLTALASPPIDGALREAFRRYPLWEGPRR
jgi:hypothetical protein